VALNLSFKSFNHRLTQPTWCIDSKSADEFNILHHLVYSWLQLGQNAPLNPLNPLNPLKLTLQSCGFTKVLKYWRQSC
jgi:hypothetical protein